MGRRVVYGHNYIVASDGQHGGDDTVPSRHIKLGLVRVASMHEIASKERSNALTLNLVDDWLLIARSMYESEKIAP